ncbi:MAG: type II toxin-antitoxin system Phd/YefM family antitoxin [Betaproteobacteria bacterium]
MRVVTFSEARRRLKWVIDQLVDGADFTVIARRNGPDAVLMSLDTFNSWRETAFLLGSPANAAHLAKSMRELQAGKVRSAQLIPVRSRQRRAKRLALTPDPSR